MNCLDNLIGISDACNEIESVSGLNINDLPGMNDKISESIVTSQDISGLKVIQKKITFAQRYLIADIRNFLQDKFKLSSILTNETAGVYKEEGQTVALYAGKFRGIRIQVNEYNYTETNISRIGIKLTTSITDNIYVYDLTSGKLLDTIEFTSIANEVVYIDVNKKYPSNRQKQSLFICIDASISDQYDTYQGSAGCSSCNKSKLITWTSTGYTTGQKIESNFISSSSSGGLTVDYNISCDIERFVCSMSRQLVWPLLFKAGSAIMKEVRFSKNLNSVVLIDRPTSEEMEAYYESEYMRGMEQLAKNIKIPDDICFQCNKKILKTIQIP